jgi:hypothetical protein
MCSTSVADLTHIARETTSPAPATSHNRRGGTVWPRPVMGREGRTSSITCPSNYNNFLHHFAQTSNSRESGIGIVATKLMIDAEEPDESSAEVAPKVRGIDIPEGFVPATKAQVAYWRQLCGAIHERGAKGMGDTDWPPELAPSHITLRAFEERRLVVRRSRAWHLRRGWYATLTLLRLTAVPTPPLTVAERPAPHLPTFVELETWEKICRWPDQLRGQWARLPILGVPGLLGTGDVSADILRGMRTYRLVRHGKDCTWRLHLPGSYGCSHSGRA